MKALWLLPQWGGGITAAETNRAPPAAFPLKRWFVCHNSDGIGTDVFHSLLVFVLSPSNNNHFILKGACDVRHWLHLIHGLFPDLCGKVMWGGGTFHGCRRQEVLESLWKWRQNTKSQPQLLFQSDFFLGGWGG